MTAASYRGIRSTALVTRTALAGASQSPEPLLDLHRADIAPFLMDAPWPPVYPKLPNEAPRVVPSPACVRSRRPRPRARRTAP